MKRFTNILIIILGAYISLCLVVGLFIFYQLKQLRRNIIAGSYTDVNKNLTTLKKQLQIVDGITFWSLHQSFVPLAHETISLTEEAVTFTRYAQQYATQALSLENQDAGGLVSQTVSSFESFQSAFFQWKYNLLGHKTLYTLMPDRYKNGLTIVSDYLNVFSPLVRALPEITGPEKKHYLVLLQNNMELRPTGGFLGSFADVVFENGALSSLKVEDIYVPDGQLKAYVEAPKPVAELLFQKGGWKLRDSNWDPNFPDSAQTMKWFFEKGGYTDIDGIFAVNFSVIQKVLNVLGPIYLPDFDQTISSDNLYSFAQTQTEKTFFPGATTKGNILGGLSRAMLRDIENADSKKQLSLFQVLLESLQTKDIMFWFNDVSLQQLFGKLHWSGAIEPIKCETANCVSDNLYVVEANVGINKTNCCMERTATYDIWIDESGNIRSKLQLQYNNHNPATPQPPRSYGGGYKNYLRLYRNKEVSLISAQQDDKTIALKDVDQQFLKNLEMRAFGFLSIVGGGEESDVSVDFDHSETLNLKKDGEYILLIQRQPGLLTNTYTIRLHYPNSVTISTLKSDISEPGFIEVSQTVDRNMKFQFSISPTLRSR